MMYYMPIFSKIKTTCLIHLCAIPYPRPQKGGRVASAKSMLCGQKQKHLLVGSGVSYGRALTHRSVTSPVTL